MYKKIINWVHNMKLWKKLLLMYLSASFVPLLGLSLFNAFSTTEFVSRQVSTRLSEITDSIGNNISRKISFVDSIVDPEIYSDDFLQIAANSNLSAVSCQHLNKLMLKMNDKLNIYFGSNPQTEFILPNNSVIGTSTTDNTADFNEISDFFEDNKYRYITCENDRVYVYYKTVNFYQGGTDAGILKITVPTSAFIEKITISGIDQYIFIIQNSNGNTLYLHSNTTNNYGGIVLNFLNRTENNTIQIRNESYVFHPLHIEKANWNLCLLIPRSILYLNFSKMLGYCIVLSVICLVIVSIFSVTSSLNLSRRINKIGSEMHLIGDGQLDLQFDVDTSGDEIGQLSLMFHQLIERINSLVIKQYKTEIKLQEEQLKILQNQINPHFLYNCMDTINWRCILNNDTQTSNFANNLADFYRTCLNRGNTRIRLSDEFKNIRSYIFLQQDMHDNSFVYEEHVNEEIYEYEGINLMLQPIVENALEHGLEISKQQNNLLSITADFEDAKQNNIRISIFNTGTPIDPEVAAAVMRGEKGYGITNVTNRIRMYFGQQYGIFIEPKKDGTLCSITIPAKRWDHE
mgnify:CR=1 FL=1